MDGARSVPARQHRELPRLRRWSPEDNCEGKREDSRVGRRRRLQPGELIAVCISTIISSVPDTAFSFLPCAICFHRVKLIVSISLKPHRISVRSVTASRRTSRDAACTMVIGRDTNNMGPTCVRASGVTCSQAIISWLPANSNHQHVVCVNNVEVSHETAN